MALKGTLKDFGIADILQLIGQQQKTGQLTVVSKKESVAVSFKDGNIVRAEATVTSSRGKKNLIGAMLVRAGLIDENQLQLALDTQKRTLQRLGDVLVEQRAITAEKFQQMVQLKTSETLFRLFTWNSGSYEFEQKDVEVDPSALPLRAESVLMEGFRRVDEWPVVKKRITSLRMTFERRRELPPQQLGRDDFDAALDDAFGGERPAASKGEFQSIGEAERLCFQLAEPGRTVQRLVELSCLGEFETAKALANLVNLDYLKGVPPRTKGGEDFEIDRPTPGLLGATRRVVLSVLVLGGLVLLASQVDLGSVRVGGNATTYTDPAAQRFVSRQQLTRIQGALEVHRLVHGALPDALAELVEEGLLLPDDLRYPWQDDYYYRRRDDGSFVLLPPLR